MRLLTASLIALTLAGCDAAEPERPGVPSGPGEITATRALADTTLDADRGEVLVDLAARFRHNKGLPLRFTATADGPALAARLDGSRLTLVPALNGAATITVQAVAGDGTVRDFAFRVAVVVPDRIEVASAPALDVFVNVAPRAVRLADIFRHLDGRPLTFTATSSAPSIATATTVGDSLMLNPKAVGTATVTVTASDRGFSEHATFAVRATPEPCWEPPTGTSDPLRLRVGEVLRFRHTDTSSHADGWQGTRFEGAFEGTLTWRVLEYACVGNDVTLAIEERSAGTSTYTSTRGQTVTKGTQALDTTRTYRHTFARSTFPRVGSVFGPPPTAAPTDTPAVYPAYFIPVAAGESRGLCRPPANRTSSSCFVQADAARGLIGWEFSYFSAPDHFNTSSGKTRVERIE